MLENAVVEAYLARTAFDDYDAAVSWVWDCIWCHVSFSFGAELGLGFTSDEFAELFAREFYVGTIEVAIVIIVPPFLL